MKPWPQDFEIREATLDDVGEIAEIHVEGWIATYTGIVPDELIASRSVEDRRREWQERLSHLRAGEFARVGVLNDRIVAVYHMSFEGGEPGDTALGRLLYMRPEAQGMGIGTHMRNDWLRAMKRFGYKWMEFWIVKENEQAQRFYADKRWKRTGAERARDDGAFHEIQFIVNLDEIDV